MLYVQNLGSGSLTFAASGASHVADGTSDVIGSLSGATYVWDTNTSLWYRMGGGSGSGVSSVTAGDASIVVGGSGSAPTVETGTLDVIASSHPAAASWSNNNHAITGVSDLAVSGIPEQRRPVDMSGPLPQGRRLLAPSQQVITP